MALRISPWKWPIKNETLNLSWAFVSFSYFIFVCLNPISRIYIADYLEKISLFLFRRVSDEDLNKWYEKRDKYELLEELGGAAYWLTFNLNVYNPLLKNF